MNLAELYEILINFCFQSIEAIFSLKSARTQ